MRIYLSLILTAILLSFLTAYFALNLQREQFAEPHEIAKIKRMSLGFQTKTQPLMELDLSAMYPTRGYFQLIQSIPTPFSQAPRFSKECGRRAHRMTKSLTDKADIWETFRCQEIPVLPDYFFERPPFIHDSGESYAYLAYISGMEPFNDSSWIKKNLNFFHISELRLLPADSLDERFKILAGLESAQFEGILNGHTSLLSNDFYLVKKQQKAGHFYSVYRRAQFERYLNTHWYYPKEFKLGEACFYQEGGVCWQRNSNSILQKLRPSSTIIFAFSVLILVLVSLSLYSRIKMQNREEERKRHALRVLTHELRTPVANLLLQIEEMNKKSYERDPALQEELLKMEGEIYRLKRLAEKSSSYLNSANDKGLITFDMKPVPSLNGLLESLLENYQEIELERLAVDQGVVLDVYWFSICLKNLVENAILHGARPIQVKCSSEGKYVRIDVIDQGSVKAVSGSAGLGMGLGIVENIIEEMKGKLTRGTSPTRFSLYLKV